MQAISRISPSRYFSLLQCPLREVWSSSRQTALLPLSPAARLGSIVHKVLELTARGRIKAERNLLSTWDWVAGKVEKEIEESPIERHLVPLHRSAYRYEVKKRMCFALAQKMLRTGLRREVAGTGSKVESEQWLETDDGKVGGLVDLIVHHSEGVELIDYKTGGVLEEKGGNDRLKQEYTTQLALYAGLYYEVYGVWPVKLTLKTLDGTANDVPFDRDGSLHLLRSVKEKLNEINRMIKAGVDPEQLACPSPEACRFCAYRPACKKYWITRNGDEDWPLDISGELVQKKTLGNGLLRVVINTGDRNVAIRGLSPERYGFLNGNVKKVLFCNVKNDSSEHFYIQAPLTVGYSLE